ncbi:MAG: peroxiredoxin [Acidobacteriota bacterium]|nr:peroxiredoxin [Acidobacteriota bacterium]
MKVGDIAPDFSLKDGEGKEWNLSEQRGRTVVLLFYPGDDTPVCTKQLCSVRDNWEQYEATGAEVVGISTDSVASHKDFADKYNLTLRLLADEKGEVNKLYDAKSWLPGRSARAVVVIDKTGRVVYHKVQPVSLFRPKDDEILEAIRQVSGQR